MKMAAHPGSDEMVLAVKTSAGHDYALVWNGSSWGQPQVLDTTSGDADVYVAYEQLSGHAMAVYRKGTQAGSGYRIWNGSSLTLRRRSTESPHSAR